MKFDQLRRMLAKANENRQINASIDEGKEHGNGFWWVNVEAERLTVPLTNLMNHDDAYTTAGLSSEVDDGIELDVMVRKA